MPDPKNTAVNGDQGARAHALLDFVPSDPGAKQLLPRHNAVRLSGEARKDSLDRVAVDCHCRF
jgi:hypothetical protein